MRYFLLIFGLAVVTVMGLLGRRGDYFSNDRNAKSQIGVHALLS